MVSNTFSSMLDKEECGMWLGKSQNKIPFPEVSLSTELCIIDTMLHPSYSMSNSFKIFFLSSRHAQLNSSTLTSRAYLWYLTSYKKKFFRTI